MLTSYNLVDYIDTSIASVVNQEMPCDWELLIGDDGSNDGTVDKIKIWIEKYPDNIKLFQIPRDLSTSKVGSRAAYNRALLLENATGDYLNYLDGDDCWLGTERLKTQIEKLQNPEFEKCSCCGHNIEAYVIPENRRYAMMPPVDRETVVISGFRYEGQCYIHTNTIVFRKCCKEKLLNPLYRNFLNDRFITFLILQYGPMLYLPKVWARYNMTGNGLWTGNNPVYGYFRNLQMLDLKLYEAPELRKRILLSHRMDVVNITNHYKADNFPVIEPLFDKLDENIFKYSFLFSKNSDVTIIDRIKKVKVMAEMNYLYYKRALKIKLKGIKRRKNESKRMHR